MSRRGKPAGQAVLDLADPLTVEIRAIAEQRRQQQEEANDEFRLAWARRQERGDPPLLPPSTLHRHNEACLGPVRTERLQANRGRQVVDVDVRTRRCSFSGVIIEAE